MKKTEDQQAGDIFSRPSKWQMIVLIAGVIVSLLFIGWMLHRPKYRGYESKISINGGATLYYNQSVSDSVSGKIAEVLKKDNYFKLRKDDDLLLDLGATRYELKVKLSDDRLLSDNAFVKRYTGIEWQLNESLVLSKPIEVKFVSEKQSIVFKLPDLPIRKISDYPLVKSLIERHIGFIHTLYYMPGIPDKDIDKVEQAIEQLKTYFPDERELNVLFLKDGQSYRVKLFEDRKVLFSPDYMERMKNTVEYMQNSGIEKPIRLTLVDQQLFYEKEIL